MIDYEAATRHWADREHDARRMPAKVLRERIEGFLSSHRVCALATKRRRWSGTQRAHRVRVVRRVVLGAVLIRPERFPLATSDA
jgi:hypothetical protein